MLNIQATPEKAKKVVELSKVYGFSVSRDILELAMSYMPQLELNIEGFNFTLKEFQAEGVEYMSTHPSVLLADEQGTGKTVQFMAYLWKTQRFPAIVVCPNTLKGNWRREITAMLDQQVRINIIVSTRISKRRMEFLKSKAPHVTYSREPVAGNDVYIVNFDVMDKLVEQFEKLSLKVIAVDEAHKVKNPAAKRTKAIRRLANGIVFDKKDKYNNKPIKVSEGITYKVLMTGTPLVNKPKDLYHLVSILLPNHPIFGIGNFLTFGYKFCAPQKIWAGKEQGHITKFDGASNTDELHQLLKETVMIRRLKEDVLPELPDKTFVTVPLEFDRREYDKVAQILEKDMKSKSYDKSSGVAAYDYKQMAEIFAEHNGQPPKSDDSLVVFGKLREIAGYAKIPSAVEWVNDFVEEDQKLVVMAYHKSVIKNIAEGVKAKYGENSVRVIDGDISDLDRDEAVESFQDNPEVRVVVCSLKSADVGLTLTAASAIAMVQLPWTWAEVSQASDRIHRIGQEDNVTIYNLIAEFTVEEDVAEIVVAKAQTSRDVIDGGRETGNIEGLLGRLTTQTKRGEEIIDNF